MTRLRAYVSVVKRKMDDRSEVVIMLTYKVHRNLRNPDWH